MTNIDTIERKIKALLTQAADQHGTPEGEAFQAKAFTLMAQYGVEEAQLNTPEGNEMTSRRIELAGHYTPLQFDLYANIAIALHCYAMGKGNGRNVAWVEIYGRERHVKRAVMLAAILNPSMIVGANNTTPSRWVHRSVQKRSWMDGFTNQVHHRLKEAESTAFQEAGEGQEIALIDDLEKAKEMASKAVPKAKTLSTSRQEDWEARQAGEEAANSVDLGQERFGTKAALPAPTR